MGLLVDTSVIILAERARASGDEGSLGRLLAPVLGSSDPNADVLISVITVSELETGVLRANTKQRRERRRAFVESVFAQFGCSPIDLPVARCHARIAAELMASGRSIGVHESWVAATGVAHGHTVVTANVDEFRRVPGLAVIGVAG